MLLKKIFKPKWQNTNPAIRIEAIQNLDWEKTEDRDILENIILKDVSTDVIKAALAKIHTITDLISLSKNASAQASDCITQRLQQMIESSDQQIKQLISQCTSLSIEQLISLTTWLKSHPLLSELVNTLANDQDKTLELVTSHPISQIRQLAVEQISKPDLLTALAPKIKSKDKGVYQKIKAKLQAHKLEQKAADEKAQQLSEMCESLEAHAKTESTKFYAEKLEALQAKLAELEIDDADTTGQRIQTALKSCYDRAESIKAQQLEESKELEENEQKATEREAIISALNNTAETCRENAVSESGLAELENFIQNQENSWIEATRHQTVSKPEQKSYQSAMSELRLYLVASKKLFSKAEQINSQLESALNKIESDNATDKQLLKQLHNHLNEIEWPEGFSLPTILQRCEEVVGKIQTIQTQHTQDLNKLRKQIDEHINRLDKIISNGEIKQAVKLAKETQHLLQKLPNKTKIELTGKLKAQQTRIEELKDWQGYATRPKQEDLCQRMELLADQHLEPHIKAQRIKDLQNEWKSLGGSSDQKLWQRFKKASDLAFSPCKEYFNEEDKLKEANLAKRESICVELDNFISQCNWEEPDWKAIDNINRKAREEWRRYYPVDHKQGKTVQQKFNALLATLDDHLNKEKERNHQRKSDIVNAANELITMEDIRQATNQAKALQKQWESIGITNHKVDRDLWNQFRKACDQIFGRLTEQRKQQHAAQEKALARANELISAAQALTDNIDESAATAIANLSTAFGELEHLGESGKALNKQFKTACQTVREQLAQNRKQTFISYYLHLVKQAAVKKQGDTAATLDCSISLSDEHESLMANLPVGSESESAKNLLLKLEILAEVESPESEKERRMAMQVERLTAGLQNSAPVHQSVKEQFCNLLAEWLTESSSQTIEQSTMRIDTVIKGIADKLDFWSKDNII